jgi:hypothetical protein
MTRTCYRSAGLAALVAAAAIGLAACAGSSSSSPQVASLPGSSGPGGGSAAAGSSATGGPAHPQGSNPTQLLDEWAACMRHHGDPGQTDPTIDSDQGIHITIPIAGMHTNQEASTEAHGSTGPCASYELAAQKALRGGQPAPKQPTMGQQLSYARCMRAHGVTKFPDPNGSGSTYVGNLDLNSPVYLQADRVCSKQNGMLAAGSPAPPGNVQVQSARPPGFVPGGGQPAERTVTPGAGNG